jgi:hypothetical protein
VLSPRLLTAHSMAAFPPRGAKTVVSTDALK